MLALFWTGLLAQSLHIQSLMQVPPCEGEANGSIEVVVAGGVAPYYFHWSNGIEGYDLTSIHDLIAGNYDLTITDGAGSEVDTAIVLANEELVCETSHIDISCHQLGRLMVRPLSGLPPFEFRLREEGVVVYSSGEVYDSVYIFNLTEVRQFTLEATDSRNCSSVQVVTLFQLAPLYAVIFPENNNYQVDRGDSLQLQVLTNHPDIDSVIWTPSIGISCTDCLDPLVYPLCSVCYTVKIWSSEGCDTSSEICIQGNDDFYSASCLPYIAYPSLFRDYLNLYVLEPSTFQHKFQVRLLDASGRTVWELPKDSQTQNLRVNTMGLAPGLYIIDVRNESYIYTKKVVKY